MHDPISRPSGSREGPRDDASAADRMLFRIERAAAPYQATLQHLVSLHRKIARLEQARREAEGQIFEAMRRDHAVGELDEDDLVLLRGHLASQLSLPFAKRWDAALPISSASALGRFKHFHRSMPNGPNGDSWQGWRAEGAESSVPRAGVSVVYVLYGETNEPVYLGSTANLRNRLSVHNLGNIPWSAYMAVQCRDREDAYEVEERLLRSRMPPMNKKASR